MKKRILLFTSLCFFGYLVLTSNIGGPASTGLTNYTGARNSSTSCGGTGCHGGTSTDVTVSITVDSSGVAVANYVPGNTYDIILVGYNTVSILPEFGFQFAAVKGVGSAQTSVGTFTTPLPSGIHSTVLSSSSLTIVEHTHPIPTSTGAYTITIPWQAPAAGTGTVRMYCTMAMVDGNGNANSTDVSNNTSISLHEIGSSAVPALSTCTDIKTYPNPLGNNLHVQMNNTEAGNYTFNIFDITGRTVISRNTIITGSSYETDINTLNWTKGVYFLQIANDNAKRTIQLVKE